MNEIAIKEIIKTSLVSEKLAAILSEKSISVEYSESAKTASIDFSRKVITFPMKANMSNLDVHMLFLCHEVGHLIFSSLEMCIRAHESKIDSYCQNVVLDIRDERLFKNAYPGFVKYFRKGYEFLLKDGFFGVPSEIMFHGFTSRLNVYAKLGFPLNSFVPMNEKEIDFYNRCYAAETEEEVNALAVELYAINKASQDEIKKLLKNATANEIEGLMETLMKKNDADTSPTEIGQDELEAYDNIFGDEIEGKSYSDDEMDSLAEKLREESSMEVEKYESRQLLNGISTAIYQSPAKIGYGTIEDFFKMGTSNNSSAYIHQWGKKYVDQFSASVKHMAMVFETKKAAKKNQNRKVSKTGSLDISRIANYRTSEDIFLSRLEVNNVKNHGVILLIDCSGSIAKMFYDLVKHMVTLTEFCRKTGIPFKVIGFGMENKNRSICLKISARLSTNIGVYFENKTNSPLVEICSSEQSTTDYFKSIYCFRSRVGWDFGGTPTTSALTLVEKLAPKFFSGIDQRKLVVLTDGEATDSIGSMTNSYVYDPVVKQGFFNRIEHYGFHSCLPMANILKMRHNIDTTIMCVGSNRSRNSISEMGYRIVPNFENEYQNFRETISKSDFYQTKSLYNINVFLMKPTDIQSDNAQIDFGTAATATQFKSKFVKHYREMNKSKILLNAVVESLSF
jgi:hypothetical protein